MKFPVFFQKEKPYNFAETLRRAKELHDNVSYKDVIYCPYCGEKLVMQERVEQLCDDWEDIMCKEPSYKLIYKCVNTENCPHGHFTKYLKSGEMYIDNVDDFTNDERSYVREALFDNNYFGKFSNDAINSIAFKSHCETYKPGLRKESELFRIGKRRFIVEFDYEFDGFGNAKYVIPKFCIRTYDEDNSYRVHYIRSIWDQIRFLNWETKSAYKSFIGDKNESKYKEIYGYSGCLTPDKGTLTRRFWYKFIVPFIYGEMKKEK